MRAAPARPRRISAFAVAAALVSGACGSSGGGPTQPSPAPPQLPGLPIAAEFDRMSAGRVGPGYIQPAHLAYSVCGSLQVVGSQNLTMWLEVFAYGANGEAYAVEQDYLNLVPSRFAPGGVRFGCGLAGASDYDLSHPMPSRGRLVVHYTQDDGSTGTVDAWTSKIAP